MIILEKTPILLEIYNINETVSDFLTEIQLIFNSHPIVIHLFKWKIRSPCSDDKKIFPNIGLKRKLLISYYIWNVSFGENKLKLVYGPTPLMIWFH